MGLRFSIIKTFPAKVNGVHEDVVHEVDISSLVENIKMFVELRLLKKKQSLFGKTKWSLEEVLSAIEGGIGDTIEDYKKITVKIF